MPSLFEREDIERLAERFGLHAEYRTRFIATVEKGAGLFCLRTEESLLDYMRIIYKGLSGESERASKKRRQKPKGFWDSMNESDIWGYLGGHQELLELNRKEVAKKAYGLTKRIRELGMLDGIYPSHERGPKEDVMEYNFGVHGRLRIASETGEILPIEYILRKENRALFKMGYRFIRNCIDDKAEIDEAIKEIQSQYCFQNKKIKRTNLRVAHLFQTYDSAGRGMKGYAAILVCARG